MNEHLYDLDIERHILASCMGFAGTFDIVSTLMTVDDFYDQRHRDIWRAIEALPRGEEINGYTLSEVHPQIDRTYAGELMGPNECGTSMKAPAYATKLAALATHRRRLSALTALVEAAKTEHPQEWDRMCDTFRFEPMAQPHVELGESFAQVALRAWERYHDVTAKPIFLPTGIEWLDQLLDGGYVKAMHVIAARPGQGKTALATQIAMSVSRQNVGQVLFFCIEMNNDSQFPRIAAQAGIPSYALHKQRLSEQDYQTYREFIGDSAGVNIRMYADLDQVEAIVDESHRRAAKTPIAMIIVDYYQNLQTRQKCTKLEALVYISQELRRLSRNLDVPVITLAQVNRAVETGKRKPTAADLSDCSQLEKDAHTILFPYLPAAMQQSDDPGEATMILAKNRTGERGQTEGGAVRWHGKTLSYLRGGF